MGPEHSFLLSYPGNTLFSFGDDSKYQLGFADTRGGPGRGRSLNFDLKK